jgi:hypothetical protein
MALAGVRWGENMRYLWVVFYYACSKGHPNQFDMYFSSKTGEVNPQNLKYRLPHELPCNTCPSGIVSGRVPLEMRLHWLTPEHFAELGVEAEPIDPAAA